MTHMTHLDSWSAECVKLKLLLRRTEGTLLSLHQTVCVNLCKVRVPVEFSIANRGYWKKEEHGSSTFPLGFLAWCL